MRERGEVSSRARVWNDRGPFDWLGIGAKKSKIHRPAPWLSPK
jgi:hypothetical protein